MCLKEKESEMTVQKIAIVGPTTFRIMLGLGQYWDHWGQNKLL